MAGTAANRKTAADRRERMGQAVRHFREAKGQTVRGLATIMGWSASFVVAIENGRALVPDVAAMAKALGVSQRKLEEQAGACRTCHGTGLQPK
jgi:transcriptional regulator with XRE-family HTH domain